MSDCKVFRTEIEAAADGGALGRDAASHAEACAACGEELRGGAALRGLVRGLGRVEAPSDFEYRLRARMASSKPGGGRGLFAGLFPVGGLAWAAVAVCVLSLTAAVYYRQARPAMQGAPGGVESASAPRVSEAPERATVTETKSAGEKTAQHTEQAGGGETFAGTTAEGVAQRESNVRHVAPRPGEREFAPREPRGNSSRGNSIDMAFSPARIQLPVLNSGSNGATRATAQGIQLGTSAGTLRVVLRDERGTPVTMRSVSFGSQEPLSRETTTRRPNPKDEEGVW